jgi:hypothetical protein
MQSKSVASQSMDKVGTVGATYLPTKRLPLLRSPTNDLRALVPVPTDNVVARRFRSLGNLDRSNLYYGYGILEWGVIEER